MTQRPAERFLSAFLAGAVLAALTLCAARPGFAQSTLQQIQDRGRLVAGVKYDTPPFGFQNDENEIVGFDVDLVRHVADELGVELELVRVTSPTRIPMLQNGNVDLVAASMTHTKERDRAIDYTITYFIGGQSLLVPSDSEIRSADDLAGMTVAVQQGTTLEQNIEEIAPEANVNAFRDYNSAWLALRQGRADALTGSVRILQGFVGEQEGYEIRGGRISVEPFGMGVRENDSNLRDRVNFILQDLEASGAYDDIYEKWFGVAPDVDLETWPD